MTAAKVCQKCETEKLAEDFANSKRGKFGLHNWCKACMRAYRQRYLAENKERLAAERKAARAENPERFLTWEAAARERSREKRRIAERDRYHANREEILERTRERRATDPEFRAKHDAAVRTRKLRQRGAMVDRHVTVGWLRERDGLACHYCGHEMLFAQPGGWVPLRATIEHRLPIARGGLHTEENCVLACSECNSRKLDKTPDEFREYLLCL